MDKYKELREALAKATPEPWNPGGRFEPYALGDNDFPQACISIPDIEMHSGQHDNAIEVWGNNCDADARLIAVSRAKLPALLAERDALRSALIDLVAVCEPNIYPQPDKPKSDWAKLEAARAALAL